MGTIEASLVTPEMIARMNLRENGKPRNYTPELRRIAISIPARLLFWIEPLEFDSSARGGVPRPCVPPVTLLGMRPWSYVFLRRTSVRRQ
jgi:hypothetical protein